MAPPPLPPDYGGGSTAGGWSDPAPPPAPAAAPTQDDDDDWGWSSNADQGRYANAPADDPWSNAVTGSADNNYNQASKADPFDNTTTALSNQVTAVDPCFVCCFVDLHGNS